MPVVLLHSTLHDRHDYDAIVPSLAREYRTIAVDWPWHGDSDHAGPRPGAMRLADTLVEIVTALDLPPAVFIGNSVGGFCATRLAITHPHFVRGLVLVNPGGFHSRGPVTRLLCAALGTPPVSRRVLPSLVRAYMKPATRADKEIAGRVAARAETETGAATAATLWRSFAEPAHDLRRDGARVAAPTLIVWGTLDPLTSRKTARNAQRSIPRSRLELLRTGHVAFSSEPEAFLDLTRGFLQSVLTSDGA